MCQAHHIHHWADGGPTALPNLVLLCAGTTTGSSTRPRGRSASIPPTGARSSGPHPNTASSRRGAAAARNVPPQARSARPQPRTTLAAWAG
nr:HNH endonuclease signature motif containing protein [Nocardioides panaciterrulae]